MALAREMRRSVHIPVGVLDKTFESLPYTTPQPHAVVPKIAQSKER